jgi:predicted ATPase/DNA-binding CsgD family transcriptional regulator
VPLALTQRRPGELPSEVTGFVGRRAELAQLAALLETARLVTVTGPGGVGKTRVSLRAAALAEAGYADGVCLVELSGLRDAELLPHTVAAALGLPQSGSQLDAVLDYLHDRQLLLILDTCEHLLDVSAMLADAVVRSAPAITVLATSRQPLDVPGEHTCVIPPLPVADGNGDAVELFAQRAATVVPAFAVKAGNRADVVRVCRRLDGIPLAIELATVRLRALPLAELADRLENRFRLLQGGLRTALPRHKTLRSAIEWSHDLCTPAERALWARLSVFAGSFDIASVDEVCVDTVSAEDGLDRDEIVSALIGLVNKSVLLREDEENGSARYRLLDTLREFGAEQLAASGRESEFRGQHIGRYVAMAEYFAGHLIDDQLAQYRALRHEHANIRAAVEYALTTPGQSSQAVRLVTALCAYWHISGTLREAHYWLVRLLDLLPGRSAERARVLITLCYLSFLKLPEGREGIALAEQLGEPAIAARGYLYLHLALTMSGATEQARRAGAIAEERLQAIGDEIGLFCLDSQLGQMHAIAGEPEAALERCDRGLRRVAGRGEVWLSSYMYAMTGMALRSQGKYAESSDAQYKALAVKAELGDTPGIIICLEALATLAVCQQRYKRAAWLLGAASELWVSTGVRLRGGKHPALGDSRRDAEDAVRGALGGHRYAALYRAGAEYPLDRLIPLIVGDADNLPPVPPVPPEQPDADKEGPLTGREREIAALVARGLSNRDIAERLAISKRTVDAHVEHIYTKLSISSRVQLVNWLRP